MISKHPHQDFISIVLDRVQILKAHAKNPNEECIAVVEPLGDKVSPQLVG